MGLLEETIFSQTHLTPKLLLTDISGQTACLKLRLVSRCGMCPSPIIGGWLPLAPRYGFVALTNEIMYSWIKALLIHMHGVSLSLFNMFYMCIYIYCIFRYALFIFVYITCIYIYIHNDTWHTCFYICSYITHIYKYIYIFIYKIIHILHCIIICIYAGLVGEIPQFWLVIIYIHVERIDDSSEYPQLAVFTIETRFFGICLLFQHLVLSKYI